jgi:hypothetical protein
MRWTVWRRKGNTTTKDQAMTLKTPDEFARAVAELAEAHQIGLTKLEFDTFTVGANVAHTYRPLSSATLGRPWQTYLAPDT